MKPSRFLQAGVILASLLAGVPGVVSGAGAVVSNLEADGVVTTRISDSTGQALVAGCEVRLVFFPDLDAGAIGALAQTGLAALLGQAQAFGTPSSIGAGVTEGGRLEFQTSQALAEPLAGLHLLVLNASNPSAATEYLLLRLPLILQGDELVGPDSHTSIHLADAELVFGASTATGFATASASLPSGFESWISVKLGDDYSDADRLPDADPDRDGRVNLIEYATGTLPSDPALVECLKLQRDASGEPHILYVRRTGDEGILCRIDYRQALGEGDWSELASAITTPAEVPFPAPEGCEWVRQALPAGDRGFVRLRVETIP